MKQIAGILLVVMVLFTASCKKETTETPNVPVEKFVSLKTGHRWVYDFVFNNAVADSLVIKIESKTGNEFLVVSTDSEKTLTEHRFIDGDYLKSYVEGKPIATAVRLMKHNAQKGDTWADYNGTDSVFYTVKQTDTLITVAAGSYNCTGLELKYKTAGTTVHNFVNNTIGLVKISVPMQQGKVEYALRKINF
jgi:hypothetical protein